MGEDETLTEPFRLDREKGEMWIEGKRHVAIDLAVFCRRLDSLVGVQVAETIVNNVEYWLGREEAENTRKEYPQSTAQEVLNRIKETDGVSGVGIVELKFLDSGAIQFQIYNPAITATSGAGKSILISYWCGVLSYLFNTDYDAGDLLNDKETNRLTCLLNPRST